MMPRDPKQTCSKEYDPDCEHCQAADARREVRGRMKDEPPPIPNDRPAVWDMVIADMKARDAVGRARYGTPLQPFNGRNALADAYAEALDMAVYLKQAILEQEAHNG